MIRAGKQNDPSQGKTRRRRTAARPQQPRLDDIARAAGVSTATASRALNRPDTVSEALRSKVRDAVHSLGYVASGAARALASNRSFTVGAVVPTLNNAIFAASISAFEAELAENGYTLLLTVSNYQQHSETELVRRLLERGVDGLMIVGLEHDPDTWALIGKADRPVVAIWGDPEDRRIPCMGFDNAEAAGRGIAHLASLGHREIAMIAGVSQGNDRAAARRRGVEEALVRHGLAAGPERFIEKPYSHRDGREAFGELMSLGLPLTAIVCGNDVLAMGAIFEAQSRRLSVPEDISIIGFDNLPITEHLQPALTTLDVPSVAMGRAAARSIVAQLRDGEPIISQRFDAPFLERGTTRRIAGHQPQGAE